MFRYGHSNFTWNGTLRDLEAGSQASCGGRSRSNMSAAAASSSSGLEVLISSLQNVGDIESTLNVLNVLDELLSAGSDRRIHYMISKGGSQALLAALVKTARCLNPNYTVLVRLLHLLAKLGCRDRRIGLKAEDADAVLLTLNVLKQNSTHARISAACLMVLQVFCSSVTAANLLGEHRGLDAVYRLIPPRSGRHLTAIKAAIDALAALLCTKANVRSAVAKGYVSGLLTLYESWHVGDASHRAVGVRLALLRCLHQLAHSAAGREAVAAQGGLRLLFHTSQACLLSQSTESLVEPSVQLMRRCHPKIPLPLRSDRSAYSFPLPGGEDGPALASGNTGRSAVGRRARMKTLKMRARESDSKDFDDDLETDLNKLRSRPDPDRPAELLAQYSQFFPELTHDFQELDSGSEETSSSSSAASYSSSSSSSSDEEAFLRSGSPPAPQRVGSDGRMTGSQETAGAAPPVAQLEPRDFQSRGYICSNHWRRTQGKDKTKERASSQRGGAGGEETGTQKEKEKEEKEEEEEEEEEEEDEKQQQQQQQQQSSLVERLLASHGARVPHHDPQLYRAAAALTRSIPGFSILAFPDFWGHLPPTGPEPMAPRKPGVQRQKVFEDVQRLFGEDIINQVVFDLEDTGPQCVNDRPDTLRFFSKFESGNLRKAVQVRRYEYDLVLNADANCSMNTQWFYFEVSNMVAGAPYRFNVINCEKTNSQFNYGMQPVLYSVREALDGRPHWVRSGTEICYYRNHFRPLNGKRGQTFYTLTFTVTFKHNEDVCYLAFHYPYTYSALQAHLQVLERSLDPTKVFFRQQPLCGSLAGNPCPLVTITACPASRGWRDMHQLRNRPCLVLTARVHPSESNASWVMRGTLEFLCSRDPVAQSLREAFVFKIIPMLNPDGVINGTHRCALNGEDLNRQWSRPSAVLSPTVYHAKGLLYYLTSTGRTPLVFCDYHGHSRKKNVFLYGCSVKETLWQSGSAVDTVGLKEDPGYRTIPKTLDRIAPAFSFNSCNYLVEKSRSATARVVVWREMGVLRSYTMESTYNGCDQGIYKGLQTGTRELEEMGVKFCHSLLSLRRDVTVLCSSRALINHVHLDSNVLDHKSHNCFEDDEPPCPEEIEYSAYSCPAPSGAQLDLDIDKNSSSSSSSSSSTSEEEEEEEGGEEGKEKEKEGQGRVKTSRRSGGSCLKSRLFPRLLSKGSMETLHLKRSQWFQDTV